MKYCYRYFLIVLPLFSWTMKNTILMINSDNNCFFMDRYFTIFLNNVISKNVFVVINIYVFLAFFPN